MSQNGQTHFKNLVSDHYGTLCIKGLTLKTKTLWPLFMGRIQLSEDRSANERKFIF